jgi:DNA-binding NtrC family response regulator
MKPRILVVFHHREACEMVTRALCEDYEVATADCGQEAIASVRVNDYALVVSNDTLSDMTGEVLTTRVRELSPATLVLITATRENAETAIGLLGPDEFTYAEKPLSTARIRYAVAVALERVRLRAENAALRSRENRTEAPVAHGGRDQRSPGSPDWAQVHRVFRFGSVREMERLMILNRLEENANNRTRSAESLEISVRTLRNKLHEYNVPARSESRRDRPEAVLV